MPKILFYYPSNKPSVQIETTLKELIRMNNEVILLTTCGRGKLHENAEALGAETKINDLKNKGIKYYLAQINYLIKFVNERQIEFVFGNLQHTNFIAVLAQYFFKAKVITFRHHFKFSQGNFGIPIKINRNEILFDRVINLLSNKIIVPSKGVYNGMKKFEKVNMKKVEIIPYLYDFSLYNSPNEKFISDIKHKFPCQLRIIMVARLIPFKRHLLALPVFKQLIEEGLDIQIIILDEGPEKANIERYISENRLAERIHLIGFTSNFIDYMAACDLLIHPSITEASNNVVKEIGLLKKVVAVCKGVGDFDDYITDGVDGYLMNIENPQKDIKRIIEQLYSNPKKINELGESLEKQVKTVFGDNTAVNLQYKNLIK